MGAAMARRLHAAGHELTLWNRTRERAEAVGVGRVAKTPADAVEDAEVVISILTGAAAVRATYLGQDGATDAAKRQVFVEMSTAGPDVAKDVAPALERAGAQFVEAPVIGSTPAIESGTLIILAAGGDAAIERARPALASLGEIRKVGEIGSGAALKLVANSMMAGVSALAAELQAAGTAAGVDPDQVFWAISRVAPVLNARKAGFVEHRYEPVTFALRDALKDVRLALELYGRGGSNTPLTGTTEALYERAAKSVGDLDLSAINSLYERQAAGKPVK
jgi:3-hydroxyisobutyrate dehydrogenase/2-hydroxy-3-oxopropionate reductase